MDKLKEIKASIEKIDKKYRETNGYGEVTANPSSKETEDVMYQMISSVYRYIDYVQGNMYNWQENHVSKSTHLPKLTASQTEKLLKAAGANEDYEIIRPSIYARANRNGTKEFEVNLDIKKS